LWTSLTQAFSRVHDRGTLLPEMPHVAPLPSSISSPAPAQSPRPAPLRGQRVSFTGTLATTSRRQACQLVRDAGGEPVEGVSRRVSMLVVGMYGWPLLPDGSVSRKLQRAEELNRQGRRIRILSEADFLELLGLSERTPASRKQYDAEQTCRLLEIPPERLRRWEQLSLIRPYAGRYDFQDMVSLRTIAELVSRGVRPETIARSLHGLAAVLPGTDRPLAQLRVAAENPRTILADLGGTRVAPDGQLLLAFDAADEPSEAQSLRAAVAVEPAALTAEGWFERGRAFEENERFEEAERAYRRALELRPRLAEAHFNLGNVLRELGRLEPAAECFRRAGDCDAGLAPAWYNLADVQEEQGRLEDAVANLRRALAADPAYADAHFNLALCLERLGRLTEARTHWAAYQRLDPGSEWADLARLHLQ